MFVCKNSGYVFLEKYGGTGHKSKRVLKFIIPREFVWIRFYRARLGIRWGTSCLAIQNLVAHQSEMEDHLEKEWVTPAEDLNMEGISEEIEKLFKENYDDFENQLVMTLLTSYYDTIYNDSKYQKSVEDGLVRGIPELPAGMLELYLDQYENLKGKMKLHILEEMRKGLPPKDLKGKIASVFKQKLSMLDDIIYQAENDAKMRAYDYLGYREYYFCIADQAACQKCKKLDGRAFPLEDYQPGVNAPLMHPNCRCRIRVLSQKLKLKGAGNLSRVFSWLSDVLNTAPLSRKGKQLFLPLDSVNINGKKYATSLSHLQGIMLTPDDSPVNVARTNDTDLKLLELMKKRDQATDMKEKEKSIREAMNLMAEWDRTGKIYSVNFFKPYEYYVVDEDVTQRLQKLMDETVKKYRPQFLQEIPEVNLYHFYNIVRNGAELDLKNQEEWQKSGYIFDGEVVDQDALGNIAYGYFGAAMGIPETVLLVGAGAAQVLAGTSLPEYALSYGDDPRDQYRIMQGITLYHRNVTDAEWEDFIGCLDYFKNRQMR